MQNLLMKKIKKRMMNDSEKEINSSAVWDICKFPYYYQHRSDVITKWNRKIRGVNVRNRIQVVYKKYLISCKFCV